MFSEKENSFIRIGNDGTSLLDSTIKNYREPCRSGRGIWRSLLSFCPILKWLPEYSKSRLYGDIVGGVTVGIMNVPQGIAYSLLAEIPAVSGLYTTLLSCALFPLFSTWPHSSLGPFAVVELMCGAVVRRLMDSPLAVTLTPNIIVSTITFLIGIFHVLLALLRISFITEYFSAPLVQGFVTGAAIHVFVAQFDTFFGWKKAKFTGVGYLFKDIAAGISVIPRTNVITLVVSISSLIFLFGGKVWLNPLLTKVLKKKILIPFELILVIIATIVSYSLDLNAKYGVKIVGDVPRGLPSPSLPDFSLVNEVWTDALAMTVVMVAVHVAVGKVMSGRKGYVVDDNQEIYGVGFVLLASGFFPVFPAANGLNRPFVLSECGSSSQISNLVVALFIFIVLMVFAPLFYSLPQCVLGVIVIVALRNVLVEITKGYDIWKISKHDFVIWLVAFVSTIAIDVIGGLITSLFFQLFMLSVRTQWPKWNAKFSKNKRVTDVCVFRFESMLIFSNARLFLRAVTKSLKSWNRQGLGMCSRVFIFDCTAITHIDIEGLKALELAVDKIKNAACNVQFAHLTGTVKVPISKVLSDLEDQDFFETVEGALKNARIPDGEIPVIMSSTNPFEFFHVTTKL